MPAFIEGLKKYLQHVWTKTANKNGDPDRRFEKPLKESPQSPHTTTHLLGQVRFLPAYLQKSHSKKTCGREKLACIHKTKQSQKLKHRTRFFFSNTFPPLLCLSHRLRSEGAVVFSLCRHMKLIFANAAVKGLKCSIQPLAPGEGSETRLNLEMANAGWRAQWRLLSQPRHWPWWHRHGQIQQEELRERFARVASPINLFVSLFPMEKKKNATTFSLSLCPQRGKNVIRRRCSLALGLIGLICSASVEGGRTNGRTCNSAL